MTSQSFRLPHRFRAFRAISALMLREMTTRYGRSAGGYVWAVLEPAGVLILLSAAFSLLLRAPSLGNSFILFYASAYLPFKAYQDVAAKTADSIRFSKSLLVYPAVGFLDAVLARFFLAILTQSMVACLLLTGILLWLEVSVITDVSAMVLAMALAALLGLGLGTLNCLLFGMFPVWNSVFNILTRPLFLASGILFIFEEVPVWIAQILWYNPLVHITGIMRRGFYPFYEASYASALYPLGVAMGLLALGLVLLRRHYKTLLVF
ncbi:MAG: ABC transporter permease [Paracoccaceae bacterium]